MVLHSIQWFSTLSVLVVSSYDVVDVLLPSQRILLQYHTFEFAPCTRNEVLNYPRSLKFKGQGIITGIIYRKLEPYCYGFVSKLISSKYK